MAEFLDQSLPPTAQLPQKLEVDHEVENNPASSTKEEYTTTTSNESETTNYRHTNGRRFHGDKEDAYFLPNDPLEAARLDLQHYTWKMMMNGHLTLVPIDATKIKSILDVGTGTGIWPLEIATLYPDIQVTGTDLSPIQPATKPANCRFVQANAEHDWRFKEEGERFDYIHSRMLTMGMHDWPRFFAQCFDHLSPGGWISTAETQFPQKRAEEEDQTPVSSPLLQWGQYSYDAAAKAGINARASENFDEMLEAHGFVEIQKWEVQWPMGGWAKGRKNKALGRLVYENIIKAIPALSTGLFPQLLGWSVEEVEDLNAKAVEDMGVGHFYCPMVLHVARKPLE